MFKRLMSSLLICSIAAAGFTAVDVSAVSPEESSVPDSYKYDVVLAEAVAIERTDGSEYSPTDNVFHISPAQLIRPLSLFGSNTHNYYNGLTNSEKSAYDMMKIAMEADHTVAIVDMIGMTDLETVARAYCAFVADNPEYFWLYGIQMAYLTADDGSLYDIDIRFNYCAGQTADNIESNYNKLMSVVSSVVSAADQYSSDYDKIKYFATYLSDNMTYNTNAANVGGPEMSAYANCWNAYGGLVSKSGVCEAYAEAFKLLCDRAGIPCVSVYSNDHEWNAVKLDGSWYYVDVTWIDTDNPSTYRYSQWLAVGTVTAKNNDNANRSHTPTTNTILADYDSKFTYPSISATDYTPASGSESGSGETPGGGTGTGSGTGSGSGTGTGSSGSTPAPYVNNKNISLAGAANYTFTASLAVPAINVTVPSSISAVINPYGVAIKTNGGSYSADGVTSPLYTIRNKTETSAVAIRATTYLTVPKDKDGAPTITVCETPDQVKSSSDKALSAYLLAAVSGGKAADEGSESKDLIEAGSVEFTAGKTIVFADATVNSEKSDSGTLMVIPKANYENGSLKGYYYGHFRISGAVSDAGWGSSDKVTLSIVFNIIPAPDPA